MQIRQLNRKNPPNVQKKKGKGGRGWTFFASNFQLFRIIEKIAHQEQKNGLVNCCTIVKKICRILCICIAVIKMGGVGMTVKLFVDTINAQIRDGSIGSIGMTINY